jgi:hypothetical protein
MNSYQYQQNLQQQQPPSSAAAAATSMMVKAVVYNNEGVRRMENGLYDDAVISFTNVLQILNPFIVNNGTVQQHASSLYSPPQLQTPAVSVPCPSFSSDTDASRDSSSSSSSSRPCSVPQHVLNSFSLEQHTDDGEEDDDDGEPHFIFRDPIEIPFNVVSSGQLPSSKLVNKFVVVIMYNLALSVHLSAMSHNDMTSLVRAQRLYELAFQMHLEDSCDVTLLYSLALMNNLGLIYHLSGEEERSRTCFKNMLATMMYLLESDEAKTIKQWDGLFSNVIKRMFVETQVAAPAA